MLAISKDFEETVSSYFGGEAFSSLKHSSIKYNILLFGKYFIQRKTVNGDFEYIILPFPFFHSICTFMMELSQRAKTGCKVLMIKTTALIL